jgi:hypothetical protein
MAGRLYTNTQVNGTTVATTSCVLSGSAEAPDEHHVAFARQTFEGSPVLTLHVDTWVPERNRRDRLSCSFADFVAWLEARDAAAASVLDAPSDDGA